MHPERKLWNSGTLDASQTQHVRTELSGVPSLTLAFQKLAEGLPDGSSRTVYNLPINQFPRDILDAMLGAAHVIADAIRRKTPLEALGQSLELRINDKPDTFNTSALPDSVKRSMDSSRPIGYMRVQYDEAGRLAVSVGALDPRTLAHYAVPLSEARSISLPTLPGVVVPNR